MPVRRNVASLSGEERAALVAAIKAMKAAGQYDAYVIDHSQAMQTPTPPTVSPQVRNVAHLGPAFCPWHREFLARFERDLGVPLPYWDWADGAVWDSDLLGGNGEPPDGHVTTGPFAHDPGDSNSWSTVQNPSLPATVQDHSVPWLTRNFGGMGSLPSPPDVLSALDVTPYDSDPWDMQSDPSFRNYLEGWIGPGLHNAAHMWVGGSMMSSTSPNDPVFFLHHANVDRIWANWQRRHYGSEGYLPTSGGPEGHNLDDPMFPWGGSTTASSVLDTFVLGYWYDDAPPPAITGLNPDTAAGGATVVIQGSGFFGATEVSFGSATASSFQIDSDTQITAVAPGGAGTVDVKVTTPIATSAGGAGDQFSYSDGTGPIVTRVEPSGGPEGTIVTITGSVFAQATDVGFGRINAAAMNVDSDTQITATAPSGTGTVDVTVVTPAGSSAANSADEYSYVPVAASPVVSGVNPASGSAAGGDEVVLLGSGLTGATAINFGAVAVESFNVDSDAQITVAQSPPGSGTVHVTVVAASGMSAETNDDEFMYM